MGVLTIRVDGRTLKQVMEDRTVPAIVRFPAVVAEAMTQFGDLFANGPEHRHFAAYLTGLFVAERKNISAITRQFSQTTDPSCLNRWLTEVRWDVEALNRRRLDWLQRGPATRTSAHGVSTSFQKSCPRSRRPFEMEPKGLLTQNRSHKPNRFRYYLKYTAMPIMVPPPTPFEAFDLRNKIQYAVIQI